MEKRLRTEDLYQALKKATHAVFRRLERDHPGERLYAFGLYTDDLGRYISPTGNTEEALLRRSGGYAKTPLRWSPCDWEYHLEGDREHFEQVQCLFDEAPDPYDISDRQAVAQARQVFEACIRVLRELDSEGLFGRGEDRERIVINLWMGDQSDEGQVRWARRLNPPSVAKRYAVELPSCREWPPEEHLSIED